MRLCMSGSQTKKSMIGLAAMMGATLLIIAASCYVKKQGSRQSGSEYMEYDFVMGTSMTQTLYPVGNVKEDRLSACAEEIRKETERLDAELLSWRISGSETAAVNENAANSPYPVSDELLEVIGKSLQLCADSNGALDITLRPLEAEWGIEDYDSGSDSDFQVPEPSVLKEIEDRIGYEHISLNEEKSEIVFDQDGISLDFGAIGKGYALDRIYDIVKDKQELSGCVIAVGGSILVYGTKKDGAAYRIGIRDPEGSVNDIMGSLELNPGAGKLCVSTSGNYEKYVTVNEKRYHHIMDRKTLAPADSGLLSVTVCCEDGLYSDGLSTACFVLGYEASLPLLAKYEAEAVFIDKNGTVYVTDGLKDQFSLTQDRYKLSGQD